MGHSHYAKEIQRLWLFFGFACDPRLFNIYSISGNGPWSFSDSFVRFHYFLVILYSYNSQCGCLHVCFRQGFFFFFLKDTGHSWWGVGIPVFEIMLVCLPCWMDSIVLDSWIVWLMLLSVMYDNWNLIVLDSEKSSTVSVLFLIVVRSRSQSIQQREGKHCLGCFLDGWLSRVWTWNHSSFLRMLTCFIDNLSAIGC